MSSRIQVMIVGIIGTAIFLAIGLTGALPWVFAGPIAATFVTGWILNELHEAIKDKPCGNPEEPEPKLPRWKARTVSFENSPLEETLTMSAKSSRRYQAKLRKGETLIAEIGADDWIGVELRNKSGDTVRNRDGKNMTVEYEAERNGNWYVYVFNENKFSLEVGVTLTVEGD